ncbi:MAG: glycosyltransferase family 2 protein [Armatimonadota bacterium]|nr:MAG: glycosyltransferase family 2 protein [Armatimonadota bacterium]
MLGDHRIAVVIPAYMAGDTLTSVIGGIPTFVDRIVVVDDGSPDATAQAAAAAGDSRVEYVKRERTGGVGAAMATGFAHVLTKSADVVVKMDADGQMDPELLPDLLAPIIEQGLDYSKGNRFYDLSALKRMPLTRRLGNVALSFLTKMASGYWNVYDPQNGYVAIRRDVLERLDLNSLDRGFFFENSMLVQLNVMQARVAEVPIPAVYGNERSSMNLARICCVFPWKLVCVGIRRVRLKYFGMDFSPIAVLITVGGLLLLGGTGYGAYEWVRHALAGVPTPAGAVMLAALPVMLGVQFLLNALLMDISQTPPGLGIRKLAGRNRESTVRPEEEEPRRGGEGR